jgi:F0F1-type ATP synthase assembly protein I
MIPNNNRPDKNRAPYTVGAKFMVVGGEVGCLTLLIVLGAVFGGLWLDRLFGTKPLLTVLLVLASAPLSLVLTFWIAKRAVSSVTPPPNTEGNLHPTEGDKTGE